MPEKEKDGQRSRKLYYIVTDQCGLNCTYCYYMIGLEKRNRHEPVPLGTKKQTIRQMPGIIDELILTGGEPLRDPDIFEIISEAKSCGLKVDLLTNGVHLTSDVRQKLINLKVESISISLDSLDPAVNDAVRGETATVKENLAALLKEKPPEMAVEIMMTVTRQNIKSIRPMTDFCLANGMNLWLDPVEINPRIARLRHLDMLKMNQEEKIVLSEEMAYWAEKMANPTLGPYAVGCFNMISGERPVGITCEMGTDHFIMDTEGSLHPCFSRKDIKLGNGFEDGLEPLRDNMLPEDTRNSLRTAACATLGCICMTMVSEYDPHTNRNLL